MTRHEFQMQLERLARAFGPSSYNQERASVIWEEVKALEGSWWKICVDRFIGEFRQAPLLPEIREAVALERERNYLREKQKHRQEAQASMRELFDSEIIGSICKTILARMAGGISDEVFSNFTRGIEKLSASGCRHCEESGLVFVRDQKNYEFVYRCRCHHGVSKPKHFAIFNGGRA